MNIARIAELLRQRIGLEPLSLGANVLPAIVAKRMHARNIADVERYAAHVTESVAEFDALIEEVVVSETWFFRGGKVFSFLVERMKHTASAPFRILSTACSTGEEPYSLALALLESHVPPERWTLEGIDLSEQNLTKARRGCYRTSSFRETPASLRRKYFHERDAGWELDESVRKLVRFRRANLLDANLIQGENRFDLIFCRNVLIYFHAEARKRVLTNLDRLLTPDGLLCMGHAEPLSLLDELFQTMGSPGYFLFERRAVKPRPVPRKETATAPSRRPRATRTPPVQAPPRPPLDLLAQARHEADAGALEAALRSCRTYLAGAATSAEGYGLLGLLHRARKENGEAAACFRKALYLDPHHEEALIHLLLLAQEDGDTAAAARLRQRLNRLTAGGEA
jgi:chemotaxis protein methyltransferase WspC